MTAYYNEIDPLKAEVLREAIKAGAIAPGDVDERSIADVKPDELMGYTQCHFFAAGGFWSLALRYAGWPDDRPVWTGSCPCPSFSAAGKGGGFDDPRHLWPYWAELIRERKPAVIFGEQADDAVGYGWLDLVQTDLEAEAYAVGKVVFGACSVGAPHIRQRLYFVADTASGGGGAGLRQLHEGRSGRAISSNHRADGVMGKSLGPGLQGLAGDGDGGDESGRVGAIPAGPVTEASESRLMGDADSGPQRGRCGEEGAETPGVEGEMGSEDWQRDGVVDGGAGPLRGFWADAEWIPCRNPKVPGGIEWRPIEPGTFPLAHGSPARVGRLRMFGDGIVVTQAQAFIEAYAESRGLTR